MTPVPRAGAGRLRRALRRAAAAAGIALLSCACAAAPRQPPPPPSDVIVLLPDDAGKTGAIVVAGTQGERLVSKPREAVTVAPGAPPSEPFIMTEKEVRSLVGPALSALPSPPPQFILYFKTDSVVLTAESAAEIPGLLKVIRDRAAVGVKVVGHTDTVGSREHNDLLSLKRARAVAALLAARGVPPSLIEISSHGKNNPLVPTGDQVPEPRNRRVEVMVF